MKPVTQMQLENAIKQFCGDQQTSGGVNYGSGHINDTYRIVLEHGEGVPTEVLILQRMNTEIFTEPVLLMENIANVTGHLKKKIVENGGDPKRETLSIISAQDGKPYYVDEAGNFWRCYPFIADTISLDRAETTEDFYQSAVAFGNFQRLLSDFPAQQLHETIPHFHDTKAAF